MPNQPFPINLLFITETQSKLRHVIFPAEVSKGDGITDLYHQVHPKYSQFILFFVSNKSKPGKVTKLIQH